MRPDIFTKEHYACNWDEDSFKYQIKELSKEIKPDDQSDSGNVDEEPASKEVYHFNRGTVYYSGARALPLYGGWKDENGYPVRGISYIHCYNYDKGTGTFYIGVRFYNPNDRYIMIDGSKTSGIINMVFTTNENQTISKQCNYPTASLPPGSSTVSVL